MSPIRTYLDTNVLIAAALGNQNPSQVALAILGDTNRVFVSSIFSRMETLPVPMRRGNTAERDFYLEFYRDVQEWVRDIELIINNAISLSGSANIDILDACHLVSAISLRADEFITAEIPNSPIVKFTGIKVTTIYQKPV